MASDFLNGVLLPLVPFITMLGMGLGLTLHDFQQVFVNPKSVIVGLFAQLIVLPGIGFLIASAFSLPPELAVGLMIVTACPGGVISNLATYFAQGNVALSITLTTISSLITVFTIPLVVNISTQSFMDGEASLQLPFLNTVIQIAVVTLVPLTLGIFIKHYLPQFAANSERWVKSFSLVFLLIIVASILIDERENLGRFFQQSGWAVLALNTITMALGYGISNLVRLQADSAKAITLEVSFQNIPLAIAIANSPLLLNSPRMAIPAVVYGLLMFGTSGAFVSLVRRFL